MTIEQKLKNLILERYRSIREFTQTFDISYSTLDSILKRGIGNSSVTNIIKICKALNISVDGLGEGRIISNIERQRQFDNNSNDIDTIVANVKEQLLFYDNLTLEGETVDSETARAIAQGIDISLEMVKRNNKNHNKNHNKNASLTKTE